MQPFARLAEIDAELSFLYGRTRVLLDERGRLVAALPGTSGPAATTGAAGPGGYRPGPATAAGPGAPSFRRPPREASAVSVQAVLLALGGVLLGTASLVFLAVAWSRAGVAGRALVLVSLTAAALAVPRVLVRRNLTATAETIAGVGFALAALDLWALWRLDVLDLPAAVHAAGAATLLAAGAAAYSLALPLRGPRPLAVVLAQLPLPLLAFADPSPAGVALALLGTAALDAALLRVERHLAAVLGTTAWALAVLVALPAAVQQSVPAMLVGALAGAAALAVGTTPVAAALAAGTTRTAAVPAGVLVLAAVAIAAVRDPLGDLLAPALVGVATVAVAAPLRDAWRRGTAAAGAVLLGGTALVPLAAALESLVVPASTAATPWSGIATVPVGSATIPALAAALLTTGGLTLAALLLNRPSAALPVAIAGTLVAATLAPVALSLPLPATLTLLAALTTLAAAHTARSERVTWTAPSAAGLAGLAVAWGLATDVATVVVLAGVAVVAAAVAGAGRRAGVRVGGAAVTVLALTAEAVAVPAAAGASVRVTAFVLLGLVAAVAGVAALWRSTETVAMELAALPAAGIAVVFAATRPVTASLASGLLGAILLAVSLRPDRRPAAYAGIASVQLAAWIALFDGGVTAPEAYTGPLSILLLAVGALRRRTGAGSWSAYGPGLLLTAVPSLLEATGSGGLRTLLLGTAALALVLLGARSRLQAPLTIGAAVLLVLALNEIGPAVLGLLADLPRWLPPAVGGAVLLAVGATYERRLRDLRRVRAAFDRLG